MGSIATKRAIKSVAKKHVEVRQGLKSKDRSKRQQTAVMLQHIANFMRGFFYALEQTIGAEKTEYYREYYRQARSAKGLNGVTKKEPEGETQA